MAERTTKPKFAASPSQLALIGVLSVILVVVAVVQFGGKAPQVDAGTAKKPGATSRPRQPAATIATSRAPAQTTAPSPRPWPRVSLNEAVQHDPFALADPLLSHVQAPAEGAPAGKGDPRDDSAAAAQEQALAALHKAGVSAVVQGEQGFMAAIGSRIVRVGDVLDGLRVIEIGPDGVWLSAAGGEAQAATK